MLGSFQETIKKITGSEIKKKSALSGGCVGDVYKLELASSQVLVAKVGGLGSGLEIEGMMLNYLGKHSTIPVPRVVYVDEKLLLMTWIPSKGSLDKKTQIHAADLVSSLHNITSEQYGFASDTVIGGLHQDNSKNDSWLEFFAQNRLYAMAMQGINSGRLPKTVMVRLEKLIERLKNWIDEPDQPSLIHGDMWSGNVLSEGGRVTGFIDPAIYFADPEIELAFTTLFSTFGDYFFSRYNEHRNIKPGFFEERKDIYNLYPLLVHVQLFGGTYVGSVENTLRKFGF